MKKFGFMVLAGVIALAAGCSSGNVTNTSDEAAETTGTVGVTVEETEEPSPQEREAEESLEAAIESLTAAEESLAEKEESLEAMEESLSEAAESLGIAAEEKPEDTVDYATLVKTPDEYKNKDVTFTGTVVQAVALNESTMQLLMAVGGDDASRMVGEYAPALTDSKLGKGDNITIGGTFEGVMRYRMGSGEKVSLPSVSLSEIRVNSKAEPETTAALPPQSEPASGDASESASENASGDASVPSGASENEPAPAGPAEPSADSSGAAGETAPSAAETAPTGAEGIGPGYR